RSKEAIPFERVSDVLAEPDTLVWVDVDSPDEREAAQMGEEFGLHPLALEDALSMHVRPKFERYEGYVFVAAYAAAVAEDGRVQMEEVSLFVSPRFLVTVRHGGMFPLDEVRERIERTPSMLRGGGAQVAYAVVDEMIDGYFPVVEAFEDRIERA